MEGKWTVGSDTQQGEEVLAICERYWDKERANAQQQYWTVIEITKLIIEVNNTMKK